MFHVVTEVLVPKTKVIFVQKQQFLGTPCHLSTFSLAPLSPQAHITEKPFNWSQQSDYCIELGGNFVLLRSNLWD